MLTARSKDVNCTKSQKEERRDDLSKRTFEFFPSKQATEQASQDSTKNTLDLSYKNHPEEISAIHLTIGAGSGANQTSCQRSFTSFQQTHSEAAILRETPHFYNTWHTLGGNA